MRPLRRGEPSSKLEATAIELLRAAERFEPAAGQKQRVTARLLVHGAPTRRRLVTAPVLALGVVLCAAVAGATVGRSYIERSYRALAEPSHPTAIAKAPPPARPASHANVNLPASPPAPASHVNVPVPAPLPASPPAPAPHVPVPAPASASAPASPPSSALASRAELPRPATTTRPPEPGEAANLVYGAMRALRQERRPDRATKLLDEYRQRFPRGALAEEALALSVEAAVQRGDARAKGLAERYLARYPQGQFRAAAERARSRFTP